MLLGGRARQRGFHSSAHIDRQRRFALILILTGLARALAWCTLMLLYLAHLAFPGVAQFTGALFASVPFVALISLYANAATDWGQVAASFAQLTAGDAHHDVQHVRRALALDTDLLESDLARLAELSPGPEAEAVAAEIRRQIAR